MTGKRKSEVVLRIRVKHLMGMLVMGWFQITVCWNKCMALGDWEEMISE